MKASTYIDCPIGFAPDVPKIGVFANAFRIVPDSEQEWFLDFCVYSQQEKEARIVSRIRVHKTFLVIMQERLSRDLLNLTPIGSGIIPFPDAH